MLALLFLDVAPCFSSVQIRGSVEAAFPEYPLLSTLQNHFQVLAPWHVLDISCLSSSVNIQHFWRAGIISDYLARKVRATRDHGDLARQGCMENLETVWCEMMK